jgi:peptide/nickel transport system substrate-binding protein
MRLERQRVLPSHLNSLEMRRVAAALGIYGLTALKRTGGVESQLVVPDLVARLPLPTDQGRTYTFQLRNGIRFSDGALLTPEAVRYTFERLFRVSKIPGLGAYWGPAYFDDIVGASRCIARPRSCSLRKGIEIDPGSNIVTFHLSSADDTFLTKLTRVWIVPRGTPSIMLQKPPVPGTGPYEIAFYHPAVFGKHRTREKPGTAKLVRNPYFGEWSKAARPSGFPSEIDWRFGVPPKRAMKEVEAGTADLRGVLGTDEIAKRQRRPVPDP